MEFSDINGEYKQIRGFDDYYITEHGEVYSTRPIGASKEHKLHKLKPKNPGRAEKYLNIILCRDDGQYTKSIHRLVAEHFVDGYFDGAVPNHKDGNNRNNDSENLEWVSVKENVHKSYITSGISAKRQFKKWSLYDPEGNLLGVFYKHTDVKDFVVSHNIPASPTMLIKYGASKGYYIHKERMNIRNCNDYPQGVWCG
jgi:hypothetical protein